jgi:prepilin-type N-terminal cleavage/methylation domain-containing protein
MKTIETSKNRGGFSLIELLIVVAIIGILAAIAIPNLLSARRAANEASAQSALRTIHNCQATYRATNGDLDFGTLDDLKVQYLTDSVLASGTKSGYTFAVTPTVATYPAQFYTTAVPIATSGVGQTGTRRFAMTEDGVLRSDSTLTVPASHAVVQAMPPLRN